MSKLGGTFSSTTRFKGSIAGGEEYLVDKREMEALIKDGKESIEGAGSAAVGEINSTAEEQIRNIGQAGKDAVESVEMAEQTAIENIQQAGNSYNERLTNLEAVNGTIADTFSTEATYAVGDIVVYSKKVYKCITAITTAGAWDATKWEELNVRDEQDEQNTRITNLENATWHGTQAEYDALSEKTDETEYIVEEEISL